MLRRTVLGLLPILGLTLLGGDLVAQGKGGGNGGGGGGGGGTPPPDPAIVFVQKTSKNVFLRVMNADGSNVRTVVTGGKWDRIDDPCWSPDGTRLAFVGSLGGTQGLWRVDTSGAGLLRIVAFAYSGMESADWSAGATPDGGDKIAFTTYDGVTHSDDLLVVNPDGSGLQLLDSGIQYGGGGLGWSFTSDALVVSDTCDFTLLHLAPAVGGGLTVFGTSSLPFTPCAGAPRAANTSDRLVYDTCCTITGLGVVDLGTVPPTATQLTFGGERMASFSPDDSRLVYLRAGNVYTRAVAGTGETLIRSGGNCNEPYWRRN